MFHCLLELNELSIVLINFFCGISFVLNAAKSLVSCLFAEYRGPEKAVLLLFYDLEFCANNRFLILRQIKYLRGN